MKNVVLAFSDLQFNLQILLNKLNKPPESSDNCNEAEFGNTQNFKLGIKTNNIQFCLYIEYFLIFVVQTGRLPATHSTILLSAFCCFCPSGKKMQLPVSARGISLGKKTLC